MNDSLPAAAGTDSEAFATCLDYWESTRKAAAARGLTVVLTAVAYPDGRVADLGTTFTADEITDPAFVRHALGTLATTLSGLIGRTVTGGGRP